MSLEAWEKAGKIKKHQTSAKEVDNLLGVVERELSYSQIISRNASHGSDGAFEHAYNAARTLAEIALSARGYRPIRGEGAHYWPIECLRYSIGLELNKVNYLHSCRMQRGDSIYESAGRISKRAAKELYDFAVELRETVLTWLKVTYPDLLSEHS